MSGAVRINGTAQLLRLQRELRAAGHENLRASMLRRVRRAAEPLRTDLRSAVRGLDIRGQGGTSRTSSGRSPTTRPLRATIADSIRLSVRTTGTTAGARVWIDRSALPLDMRGMPKALNDGRWRHPVFGSRRRWATQYATPGPWWDRTVAAHRTRMNAEVARILDDVQSRLN